MKVKAKYIVVYGWQNIKTGKDEFITVIGAYDTPEEAYGAAFMNLNDLIVDESRNGTISPLFSLEGETGYGMKIVNGDDKSVTIDYAYVLFNSHCEEESK
jgi:hypothetical protein